VGIVGNLNYMEIADLAAGFAGIDIGGDDGRINGRWPWEPQDDPRRVSPAAQRNHEQFFLKMEYPEKAGPAPTP
jgi:hypothetical protein